MKKILIALLVCFSFVTANAKDYSKYYQNLPVQMQQPTLPSIPDNHVSILECGGNGDGLTMNTQAFAKAISKLNKTRRALIESGASKDQVKQIDDYKIQIMKQFNDAVASAIKS